MAARLRLIDRLALYPIDILDSTAFRLRTGGWQTQTAPSRLTLTNSMYGATGNFEGYSTVTETFGLIFQNDTVANITTQVFYIEHLQDLVRRWHTNPMEQNDVWLEWNADGESPKRSLVYDIQLSYPSGPVLSPFMKLTAAASKGWLSATLTVTRHALWEDTTSTTETISNSISALGGVHHTSTYIYGSAPARIWKTGIRPWGGSYTFENIWVGAINQNYDYFVSNYECEKGTPGTDTAMTYAANCSPVGSGSNNILQCTFATTDALAKRMYTEVQDHVDETSLTEQAGTYMVLARCYLTSATEVRLQLRYGMSQQDDDEFIQCEDAFFSEATTWRLIELGQIQIPSIGRRYEFYIGDGTYAEYLASVRFTELQLWAERLSGIGQLYLDCLILIPTDHSAKFTDISLPSGAYLYHYTYPNDTTGVLTRRSSNSRSVPVEYSNSNWYLPAAYSTIVMAAERTTGQVITDYITGELYYYKRWLSYRAA